MDSTKLLEILYNQESIFVEEIYRLEKHPEQANFILVDDNSGLLCLDAEEDTSDWNIVRVIGDSKKCKSVIPAIPYDDYALIGAETEPNKPEEKSLIFFEGSEAYGDDENEDFELNKYANIEFGLPVNSIKTKVSHVDSRLDDIYLYMSNSVQGFVKVTRNSWHYAEVAIEIKAELRNQGYGTALLALMLEQARRKKVRLSYVAESDNFPSIAIAEHCGLSRIAAISFSQKHMGN